MQIQQLARTDAAKVFIMCRNTSGGTLSAGASVYFETDAVTDGNAVSQQNGLLECVTLFAGITNVSMIDDAYGLVQVYGYRASAYVSGSSGTSNVGLPLIGVTGGTYLVGTTTAAAGQGAFVSLMETVAVSTISNARVFIRAL